MLLSHKGISKICIHKLAIFLIRNSNTTLFIRYALINYLIVFVYVFSISIDTWLSRILDSDWSVMPSSNQLF